jgi:hypothetical protein
LRMFVPRNTAYLQQHALPRHVACPSRPLPLVSHYAYLSHTDMNILLMDWDRLSAADEVCVHVVCVCVCS